MPELATLALVGGPGEVRAPEISHHGVGLLGLFLHGRGRAMELEEQGRGFRQVGALVGVDGAHAGRVEEFASRYGDAHADDGRRCSNTIAEAREGAARRRHALGDAEDPQGELGDDREGALGAHEQAREVVARAVLARGATRLDHGAIGEHRRERKHVVAHGSIAHRGRAGGARGCHTPERGVRTRIDGEEEPVAREALIERHTAHPCLNDDQQVIGADIEDRVHLRQVQAHAAVDRQHMPFQG